MQRDTLDRIIEAEKDIAGILEEEKRKSLEGLNKTRIAAEEMFAREEERLREAFDGAVRAAKTEAEKTASEMMNRADREAQRLSGIGDEQIEAVLKKRLSGVLPVMPGQRK